MTVLKYDLAKLAKMSDTTIYVDPNDTWSSPCVYVMRRYSERDVPVLDRWLFRISHSSSGSNDYNTAAVERVETMIAKLRDCADTVRDLIANVDKLEAVYQEERARLLAEYEAERVARQAAIDAGTQVTERIASHVVATIMVDMKHGGQTFIRKFVRIRGEQRTKVLKATVTMGGAVQFKLAGELYSKAKLIAALQKYAEIRDTDIVAKPVEA